jgi:hypothetical protein
MDTRAGGGDANRSDSCVSDVDAALLPERLARAWSCSPRYAQSSLRSARTWAATGPRTGLDARHCRALPGPPSWPGSIERCTARWIPSKASAGASRGGRACAARSSAPWKVARSAAGPCAPVDTAVDRVPARRAASPAAEPPPRDRRSLARWRRSDVVAVHVADNADAP